VLKRQENELEIGVIETSYVNIYYLPIIIQVYMGKHTNKLIALAAEVDEKYQDSVKPIDDGLDIGEQEVGFPDDANLMNKVKTNLYKMNVPMVELTNMVDVLLKDSKQSLESGDIDKSKYDLAVALHQLTRQYIHLFRKFK
jgi:hypothetical protein